MSSRTNPQEYQVLKAAKFEEFCKLLGLKELCCLEPDKKVIEKGFRKKALKCHPDKGGDPVEFKKLNDAYNRLIGHIEKLDQQAEAIELANSILIEISKTAVPKWHEKLKTRYGWFKSDNCKNILFDGPYKQYMGRSKNTGSLTIVLYEDPPDAIPKIHIRTKKYMAWIAEQGMPVHMHVDKGRAIQFDQWRIAHLAEFGISTFVAATPSPARKEPPKKEPKTPKAKRKGREDPENNPPKARRDSAPTPEPDLNLRKDKENTDSSKQKNEKANNLPKTNGNIEEKLHNCGHCGAGFDKLIDYVTHKKICLPDEDFGLQKNNTETAKSTASQNKEEEEMETSESKIKNLNSQSDIKINVSQCDNEIKDKPSTPSFQCNICNKAFTNMVWYTKHQQDKSCVNNNESPDKNNKSNTKDTNEQVESHPTMNGEEKFDKKTLNSDIDKSQKEPPQEENKNIKTFECFSCNRIFTNVIWLNKHLKSQICMDKDKKLSDPLVELRKHAEKLLVNDIKKNDSSSNSPPKKSCSSDIKENTSISDPKQTVGDQTELKETSDHKLSKTGSLKSEISEEDKKNTDNLRIINDKKISENNLQNNKDNIKNPNNKENEKAPKNKSKNNMESNNKKDDVESKQNTLDNPSNLPPKTFFSNDTKESIGNSEPKQTVLNQTKLKETSEPKNNFLNPAELKETSEQKQPILNPTNLKETSEQKQPILNPSNLKETSEQKQPISNPTKLKETSKQNQPVLNPTNLKETSEQKQPILNPTKLKETSEQKQPVLNPTKLKETFEQKQPILNPTKLKETSEQEQPVVNRTELKETSEKQQPILNQTELKETSNPKQTISNPAELKKTSEQKQTVSNPTELKGTSEQKNSKTESLKSDKNKKDKKSTDNIRSTDDKENKKVSTNILQNGMEIDNKKNIETVGHVTKTDSEDKYEAEPMEVDDENKKVQISVVKNKLNAGSKVRKKGVAKKSLSQEPLPTAKPSSDMAKIKKTVESNINNNSEVKHVENSVSNEITSNETKTMDDKLVTLKTYPNESLNVEKCDKNKTFEKEEIKVEKLIQKETYENKKFICNKTENIAAHTKEINYVDIQENKRTKSDNPTSIDKSKTNVTCKSALKQDDESTTKTNATNGKMEDSTSKSTNITPDKTSKPAVTFNLEKYDRSNVTQYPNLDHNAIELSNRIFPTSNNECSSEEKEIREKKVITNESTIKNEPLLSKSVNLKNDSNKTKLDLDAIKITNEILNDGTTGASSNQVPIENVTTKSILKKSGNGKVHTSPNKSIQENKHSFEKHKDQSKLNLEGKTNSCNDDTIPLLPLTSEVQSQELSSEEKVEKIIETIQTVKPGQDKLNGSKEHSLKTIVKKETINSQAENENKLNTDQTKTLAKRSEIKEQKTNQQEEGKNLFSTTTFLNINNATVNNKNIVPENKIKQKVDSISTKQKEFTDPNVQTNSPDTNVNLENLKNKDSNQIVYTQSEVDKSIMVKKKTSNLANKVSEMNQVLKISNNSTKQGDNKLVVPVEDKKHIFSTQNKCILPEEKNNKPIYNSESKLKETESNKLNVKHAKQYLVVNSPVTPCVDKKVRMSTDITKTANKEGNKPRVEDSLIVPQKESSGRKLYFEPQALTDEVDKTKTNLSLTNDLKDNLEKLDQKHAVNLKVIEDRYTKNTQNTQSDIQNLNLDNKKLNEKLNAPSCNTELDIAKSRTYSSPNNENVSDRLNKTNMKVPEHKNQKHPSPKKTVTYANEAYNGKNANTNIKLIDEKSKSSKAAMLTSSSPNKGNSKFAGISAAAQLEEDLRKLDQTHATKLQNINNHFEETYDKKKPIQLLSDPHADRPSTLGSSRFENTYNGRSDKSSVISKFANPTGNTKDQYVPKRNETVHNIASLTLQETTSNKTLPLIKSTTTSEFHPKSEYLQRKFNRNFIASPEPFFRSNKNLGSSPVSEQSINKVPTSKDINYPNSKTQYVATTSSSSANINKSAYMNPTSPVKPFPDVTTSLPFPHSDTQYKTSSRFDMGEKSEGTMSLTNPGSMQSGSSNRGNFSLSTTACNKASNSDLYLKIQATKEQHKVSLDRAKKYDPSSHKPIMITQKLPLPDGRNFYTNLTAPETSRNSGISEQKESRRMDRERNVMNRLIGDRTMRGRSDDLLLSKSTSQRL